MLTALTVVAAVATFSGNAPPASEVIRSAEGNWVTVTNAGEQLANSGMLVVMAGEEELLSNRRLALESVQPVEGQDLLRIAGPIPFGVVGDAMYQARHSRGIDGPLSGLTGVPRFTMTRIECYIDRIEHASWYRDGLNGERARQMRDFNYAHASHCTPLVDYIKSDADALNSRWDITFDYIYTSLDQASVLMVRNGALYRWQLDQMGIANHPWHAYEPFPTNIEGVFRMFMAGPELANHYIIDEQGNIYHGYDRDHRQVGSFQQYHHPRETTLTIIFEDQMTQKIAVVHATEEGDITPLDIIWRDESFADDFITTELDDAQITGIRRLAEAMREDAQGE